MGGGRLSGKDTVKVGGESTVWGEKERDLGVRVDLIGCREREWARWWVTRAGKGFMVFFREEYNLLLSDVYLINFKRSNCTWEDCYTYHKI